ncbi:MAG: hypothetical protein U0230_18430 [Polyangiales bacterium]
MSSFARPEDDSVIRPVKAFEGARDSSVPLTRLEEVRRRARLFREEMLGESQALFYKTCELVRVPYPVRYAFANVYTQLPIASPVLHIVNRLYVVQFKSSAGVKTLLFSPSDVMANAETRFFKRLGAGELARMPGKVGELSPGGILKTAAQVLVAPQSKTVVEWVESLGLRPEQIDYISYDHLHTQDLRNWFGADGKRGEFPNAKLLIMRREWDSAQGLLPSQADWYCPNGTKGLDPSRVVLLDGDVKLGEGVALVRSPGHTMGNHSLVVNTPEGLMVSSENGVSAENYAPHRSRINAVKRFAKNTGAEVVLNGNTQESSVEQYISMVMEKEIAGPSVRNPEFPNVVPSSEFASWWLFRGLDPTFRFGDLEFGTLRRGA